MLFVLRTNPDEGLSAVDLIEQGIGKECHYVLDILFEGIAGG